MTNQAYRCIVIGASYGGIEALRFLLPKLSKFTNIPILVVQHIKASSDNLFANQVNKLCQSVVKEAISGNLIKNNLIYIAPGGYHLLVEETYSLAISKDEPVKFSRPSIDVLFESAADVYKNALIAILLTGANDDGADGIAYVHSLGGLTIVQDPMTAVMQEMPQAAIDTGHVDVVLTLSSIVDYVKSVLPASSLRGCHG